MPWECDVPEATVRRLSTYLAILRQLERQGRATASSSEIGSIVGVNAAQVRKDLSYFGDFGRRGLGYRVPDLRARLMAILGVDVDRNVIVVGAGNLGSALVGYPGFEPRGFRIVGVFDNNPVKVGRSLYGHEILPMSQLASLARDLCAEIAIVAVPAPSAQEVVDTLVEAGVRCILNLAPTHVTLPPGIALRSFDMTTQLEMLSYCLSNLPEETLETRTE